MGERESRLPIDTSSPLAREPFPCTQICMHSIIVDWIWTVRLGRRSRYCTTKTAAVASRQAPTWYERIGEKSRIRRIDTGEMVKENFRYQPMTPQKTPQPCGEPSKGKKKGDGSGGVSTGAHLPAPNNKKVCRALRERR